MNQNFRFSVTTFGLMMMIAFLILNSSLVPLIEGLCSSNPVGFELSVLLSHLLFSFLGRKNMLEEKTLLVPDLVPPPSMYTHICTL